LIIVRNLSGMTKTCPIATMHRGQRVASGLVGGNRCQRRRTCTRSECNEWTFCCVTSFYCQVLDRVPYHELCLMTKPPQTTTVRKMQPKDL
jgi:hypothetical protein